MIWQGGINNLCFPMLGNKDFNGILNSEHLSRLKIRLTSYGMRLLKLKNNYSLKCLKLRRSNIKSNINSLF